MCVHTQSLAQEEEAIVSGYMSTLLQCQMQQIQLKMKSLAHIEALLKVEREQVLRRADNIVLFTSHGCTIYIYILRERSERY
jgi:hypothetical protein